MQEVENDACVGVYLFIYLFFYFIYYFYRSCRYKSLTCAYTMDGEELGEVEMETFSADFLSLVVRQAIKDGMEIEEEQ